MKKSIFSKLGAGALVLTLVTASLVGGTFAKYTSEQTGTGTVTIASWKPVMKSGSAATNLDFVLKNDNNNAETATGEIAPGSVGEIPLYIDGTNIGVEYEYSVEIDVAGLGSIPLEFYKVDASGNKGDVITKDTNNKIILSATDIAAKTNVDTKIIWEWPLADDTVLGETEVAAKTLPIKMTATQIAAAPAVAP